MPLRVQKETEPNIDSVSFWYTIRDSNPGHPD